MVAPVRRSRGGLSAQIVRATLAIGAVTIVAAAIVSSIYTYRLSAEKDRSSDERVLASVDDQVESHLHAVSLAVEQAIMHAFSTSDGRGLEDIALLAFSSNRTRMEELYVVDRVGRVVSAAPQSAAKRASLASEPAFRDALAGRDGFTTVFRDDESWQLWMTRTTIDRQGRPLIVLVRLNTGFLARVLSGTTDEASGHRLCVFDGERLIAHAGGRVSFDLADTQFRNVVGSSGTVDVRDHYGDVLSGRYVDVALLEGLSWRTMVLRPASATMTETLNAVAPALAVLLLGGVVALALSYGLSRRLSRPLRELERAALVAASGAYVRPISIERDDEIGQVADAFNAVSLRLNALHDLSQLLASASQLDQVLDGILAAMGHLVGPGAAAIYLLDAGESAFVPVRTRGRELSGAQPVSALESGWLNSALATNDPVAFSGTPAELERELPGFAGDNLEALAAPLVAGREQLGVVVIARDAERPLSEGEREMLRTFSAQASVAVQTSRLFEEESSTRRTAEALRAVAEELVRPESLEAALGVVEGIVAELFSARRAVIALVDRAAVGLGAALDPEEETRVLGVAYRALGVKTRADGHVQIVRGADLAIDRLLDEWESEQLLVVPIALETDRGGALVVGLTSESSRTASQVAEALADEIALALDNAYFYQRAVIRAANLETIFRITQAVGSSLQINVVLNRVLDVVQKILSADAVALMSYDDRARVLKTTMGRGDLPGSIMSLELQPGQDVVGEVFRRGEPVALRDLHREMGGLAGSAAATGLRSMLAVPLLARGRSIGVLIVFSTHPGSFMEEDVNVLQTFASQAALAIDTARLYSREHEVASVLQQSILPEELPEFPEIEAGSVYAPAGGDVEIGGDYYDLFRSRDGAIWFAIGDVCGKGVHAATKTSMIKYVVRALVLAGHSPGQIMGEVNEMIAQTGDPSDIVTLWLGRYRPEEGTLQWADGGHPPGLLSRADGSIERLEVTGALLGAVAGAPYTESQTDLGCGDTVLLYTDGVTEARRGNIFFGEDRVTGALDRRLSADEIARRLLMAVTSYVRGELRDDVAVLVVRPRCEERAVREECQDK